MIKGSATYFPSWLSAVFLHPARLQAGTRINGRLRENITTSNYFLRLQPKLATHAHIPHPCKQLSTDAQSALILSPVGMIRATRMGPGIKGFKQTQTNILDVSLQAAAINSCNSPSFYTINSFFFKQM